MMLQSASFVQAVKPIAMPGQPIPQSTTLLTVGKNADTLELLESGHVVHTRGESRRVIGVAMLLEAIPADGPGVAKAKTAKG